jgi:recombination protein RecT
MSTEELKQHGLKFSQTYKKGFGLWKEDFESMAMKTVLKLLLSKFAPLSVEMQTATIVDQSIVRDSETLDVSYLDNLEPEVDPMADRIEQMIQSAGSTSELLEIKKSLPAEYSNSAELLGKLEERKNEILSKK